MADHGRAEGRDDVLAAYVLVRSPLAGIGFLVNEHRRNDWRQLGPLERMECCPIMIAKALPGTGLDVLAL